MANKCYSQSISGGITVEGKKMCDYESLERKFHRLLDLLREVLTESEMEECLLFLNAGEYGIALETLCAIFEEEKKDISLEAFSLIRELGEQMLMDCRVWEHLALSVSK
jgi:hypothetical protein